MNFLKKMIGSNASALSFTLDKEIEQPTGENYWRVYEGKRKTDAQEVTAFVLEKSTVSPENLEVARHAFQCSPKYHHPYILKYLDGDEMETQLAFCTESATPLLQWASSLEPTTREDEITWGLFCLFNILKFLHEDCKVSHSNIGPHSVFVSKSGDWKLGGMELIGKLSDSYHSTFFTRNADKVPGVRPEMLAPEVGDKDWVTIENGPVHALDIWGVGKVVEAVYNEIGVAIPSSLERYYQKMVSPSPTGRAKAAKFLQAKYFKTPLVNALTFLDELHLKEPEEKQLFFRNIDKDIDTWPKQILTRKMLKSLVDDLEISIKLVTTPQQQPGNQVQTIPLVLPAILKIASLLEPSEFSQTISPLLGSVYSISDRGVRVALLNRLESYADKLDSEIVNKRIFDPVCMGFQDNSPPMREITLKSMVHLVDKLSEKNLNDKLIKYLTRLQGDPEPGIRTNVTIFLGKIVNNLTEKTRSKVLVPSLVRGLRDPFPHARMASIKTIGVCALSFVEPQVIATNLMPNIAASLVDPIEFVRKEAFKVMDQMIEKLQSYSETLRLQEETHRAKQTEQARMNGGNNLPPNNLDTENVSAASEGWTSWALGKLATGVSGAMAAAPNSETQATSPPSSQGKASDKDVVKESDKTVQPPNKPPSAPSSQTSQGVPDQNNASSSSSKPISGMKLSSAPKIKPPADEMAPNLKVSYNKLENDFSEKKAAVPSQVFQGPSFTPTDFKQSSSTKPVPLPAKPNVTKVTNVKKLAAETSKDFWDDF